jgi:uncharacterized protein
LAIVLLKMNIEITQEIPALTDTNEWRPLAASARNLFMGVAVIWAFFITLIPACVFVIAEDNSRWLYVLGTLALVLSSSCFAGYIGFNRWRNTFWKLDEEALYVKRGKTWFKQICVPRSRVQHLDFERGPLERKYGLATLVIHTAGSQERAVRQSGLLLEDAEYLRDVLVPKDHPDRE